MRLTVERLGHLGDGIAQGPEGPVFVPRILPGEVVEGQVDGERMQQPAIVTPSPDRRRAPCPHYAACGGCALMHATDAFVEGWKAAVVRGALEAQGIAAPIRAVQTSPARSRRRAVLAGRRTRKGAIVGFHGRASGTLADLGDCHLIVPGLAALLPDLRRLTELGGTRQGELAMTLTQVEGGVDLSVIGGKPPDRDLLAALAGLAGKARLVRLSWNGEVIAAMAPARVRFGRAMVALPPGAFLQATAEGEAALVGAVRDAVGPARRVADLFAGAGTFSLPLAERSEVMAAESDPEMVRALDQAARLTPGLHRICAEVRDLFRRPMLPEELDRCDAVVLDPPRAGAEAQCAQLAQARVPVVAYVSCNPVTFARDVRRLVQGGFALDWIEVVDQFRWSAHVEVVARLTRAA